MRQKGGGIIEGAWLYSAEHGELCRVIDVRTLWGETTCRIWLPSQDIVVRVRADLLKPLTESYLGTPDGIAYITAAARVADALDRDLLIAPIESSVIPLPHQIHVLSQALSNDRVRYLLADEVGLGKTIEAGLIMRELKLRGLVKRVLVVAPKGLVTQWVAEMRTHFNEEFRLLIPSDLSAYRRIVDEENIWRNFDQVICPMDSVKPVEGRRGWSHEQLAEYNRERFEDLVSAGWDMVIVDEAHRLGGSTDQVARYKLGQGLSEAAPYLLLLSATPHQGKTDAFHRLVSLLDSEAFPDAESVTRDRIRSYVIRTEKRRAITAEGKPLFKPRRTQLVPVSREDRHHEQRLLYDAVTEYVRQGYNRAIQEKRNYVGFLMILMQRLVVSSTRAIRVALERRLEVLEAPEEQPTLLPTLSEEEWAELDGQEQLDTLLKARLVAPSDEGAEVNLLLDAAKRCEETTSDAKAEALLDWIYRLQQEESDPDLKMLIFTEFVPTQEMLRKFLSDRGFSVACLNGSMDMEERIRAQGVFAREARILVSTDAGGEGLNLQFCHVVVNYDMPWNPMKIEQRIGRVDRIGQNHAVRAVNFVLEDSVEHRVREVLEEKLDIILKELGIDKAGDVLDSAQAGEIFDELYVDAILHPETVDASVENVVNRLRAEAEEAQEAAAQLESAETLDPAEAQQLIAHPLPHWVERMTVSYLRAHGGRAEKRNGAWDLTWPDGERVPIAVFTGREAEQIPTAQHLTLESPQVRDLVAHLPRFVQGQPIPVVDLPGIPNDVRGVWSLWRIGIQADDMDRQRIMPLFQHDDGRCLVPTAKRTWDEMLSGLVQVRGGVEGDEARGTFGAIIGAAEQHGKQVYEELLQSHRDRLNQERDKGEYAFAARRRAVERIGLPAVRNHRLAQLEQEEKAWREQLERQSRVNPELVPLILVRMEKGG